MREDYRSVVPCFVWCLLCIAPAIASIPSVEQVGKQLLLGSAEIEETPFAPSGKPFHSRRLNPSIGEGIKVLVLPIKFADHGDRKVPTKEYLEEFFNGDGSSEVNEVGSVRDWLRRNSNGKYVPQFVIQDWDVSTKTEKETAGGTSGMGQNFFPFFQFALNKIDNDPDHDWWSGFVSPEGYLNHLVVLHSGYMAESSKFCTVLLVCFDFQ